MSRVWLVVLVALVGCGGQAAESNPAEPSRPACNVSEATATTQVFEFTDPATHAPGCEDLGSGRYLCPVGYCLFTSEAGTCPHCGGGGE